MRIACVAVPDLPLQAWRRTEPAAYGELASAPLAITEAAALTSRLIALSDEALALGARLGQTAAQARAGAPSLVIKPIDRVRCEAARAALCDAAFGFGARMEPDGDALFIEVGDLGRLYPARRTPTDGAAGSVDERAVALALVAAARAVGLTANVAVASSKGVARLAAWTIGALRTRSTDPISACFAEEKAKGGPPFVPAPATSRPFAGGRGASGAGSGGVVIVPPGGEAKFIAPLPVAALAPSVEALAALDRWGVRTCGRLAALPPREVALRLGGEGERLFRLANGRSDDPLAPRAPEDEIEEGMVLDFALGDLEALGFVLRGLIDRLLARLASRQLACAGLGLRLHLEPRGYDVREVALAAPTREPATLLEIVRLAVEKRPPSAPVVGVTLLARSARAAVTQLDLFRPAGPAPDRLAATVARLQALVGEERVGAPTPVDTYRDEAMALRRFPVGDGKSRAHESANGKSGCLGLRRFRPEREVEVILDGGWPRAFSCAGIAAHVVVAAGPYRVSGEWWTSGGFARDHWDVHASDGAVYRLYCDAARRWFLDGYYD